MKSDEHTKQMLSFKIANFNCTIKEAGLSTNTQIWTTLNCICGSEFSLERKLGESVNLTQLKYYGHNRCSSWIK